MYIESNLSPADPAPDVQADAHVLQLLGAGARAGGVPVRTQARVPRRQQPPQPAALRAHRDFVLPVNRTIDIPKPHFFVKLFFTTSC